MLRLLKVLDMRSPTCWELMFTIRAYTILNNKRIAPMGLYGLFLTCEKNNKDKSVAYKNIWSYRTSLLPSRHENHLI